MLQLFFVAFGSIRLSLSLWVLLRTTIFLESAVNSVSWYFSAYSWTSTQFTGFLIHFGPPWNCDEINKGSFICVRQTFLPNVPAQATSAVLSHNHKFGHFNSFLLYKWIFCSLSLAFKHFHCVHPGPIFSAKCDVWALDDIGEYFTTRFLLVCNRYNVHQYR